MKTRLTKSEYQRVLDRGMEAERKRILNDLMGIDKAADSHFNFSMAMKAWISKEFKEELKEFNNG